MKKIVIMQPYFIPWYGFFEQIKLSDIYVFYDDVQFMKRSLMKKVSIKTQNGSKWLTVPVRQVSQKQQINQTFTDEKQNWRKSHLNQLWQNYRNSIYFLEMMNIAEEVYSCQSDNLADFSINAIYKICEYYGMQKESEFFRSSDLNIRGEGSQRLINISRHFSADVYLTGMGALNYLDFDQFTNSNLNVEFFKYARTQYDQLYGEFEPYVSILDLIANTGQRGTDFMHTTTEHWQTFIKSKEAKEYLKIKKGP